MKYLKFLILAIMSINLAYTNQTTNNLSEQELATLKHEGELVKIDEVSKLGFIVFDINKNIDDVFAKLTNFSHYSKKIDDIEKVIIYDSFADIIKVQIFIDTFFISFSNYVTHFINKKDYKISWHLDDKYKEQNYFGQMNGYWKLKKIDKNKTRVFYSNDLSFKAFMPTFLKNILAEQGLHKATSWIREP